MSSRRLIALILLAVCCLAPRGAVATAIANSTLNFLNLTIEPVFGSLTLDDVWLLQGFASVNNSLGESDAQFDFAFSPGTVSQTAGVTWATATGTATAPGDPADLNVSGLATSLVNISAVGSNAAFATGTGTLFDSFTVSGTGTVNVQFAIDVSGLMHAFTDALGLFAETETTFSLQVDGDPVLFDDRPLSIGPNAAQTQAFSTRLTNTIPVIAGVSHSIVLEADSESQAQTRVVSEPPSSSLLAGSIALLWIVSRARATTQGGRRWPEPELTTR